MAKLVSKIYGDALFETASETGRIDEFFEQVQMVETILQENKDLFRLMEEPDIDSEEKEKILKTIFEGKILGELTGLFLLLEEKGRFREVGHVLDYFVARVKEEKKIGIANVISAMPLSKEQKEKIETRLLATTDYQSFEIKYEVDPTLIGGIVVRIGDRIVDGSIRTKLENLSRMLKKIQIGGEQKTQKRGEMAP